MTDQPRRATADIGFTVIVCQACADTELPLLQSMRETVRRCPHGVLLSSGCILGRLWCHGRKNQNAQIAGPALLVQPCTVTREPVGPVIPVGPLKTREDLTAVDRWLQQAPRTGDGLPARLRRIERHRHEATRN